jgi:hypothetical protein
MPLKEAPMAPTKSRLAGHLRLLGILWIAVSAFRLVPSVTLMILLDHGFFRASGAPPFVSSLLEVISGALLVIALAGAVTGWGLLTRQSWARIAAIVLGGLNLIDMPFGTALGIYTLWVLLPVESAEQYEQMGRLEATDRSGV